MARKGTIQIINHSQRVEDLLEPYREKIGRDFEGYRGHIYRVLSYTLYFLDGDESLRDIIETALVYHDLGLWSDGELAYLEPSMDRVATDNRQEQWEMNEQLLRDIIFYHHKITAYKGPNEKIVNAVRKADWIDATKGILSKGMPRQNIRAVSAAIPESGFYDTLMRLGPELTGGKFFKMIRKFMNVYKI